MPKKSNRLYYYSLGLIYLFILNITHYGEPVFDQTIQGLPLILANPLSLLYTLFFQMIFYLLVFDQARDNFYFKRVVFLIRQKNRQKQYLICLWDNFRSIISMNALMLGIASLYFRHFSIKVLPFFILQTLAIYGFIILQTFIEIKMSATISLLLMFILFVLLNSFDTQWMSYIHTIRLTGNVYLAIGITLVVDLLLILLTSHFIKKQEILL